VTENDENIKVGGIYSKFSRIALVVLSMLLIFAGPTYVPYILTKVHIDYVASIGVGFVLFVVGVLFMLFLMRKKIITA